MTIASTYSAADDVAVRERADGLVRFAVWLTLGMLALRLVMATQVQLFFDEAYYWLWSEQLQGAYYDHPPMVALFIRAGTLLFGETELGVRFFGNIAAALDALLVFAIVQDISGSRRTAAWAAIFTNLTIIAMFSLFIVPDQPMILFWLAGLYGLVRISRGGSERWWLFVGAMGGLAAASKLTTIFLALAVPLWLVLVPGLRHWFRQPWIYAGAAMAVLVFTPALIWNAQHDWISFTFQYERADFGFSAPRFDSLIQYLGLFPLMATPPIFILAIAGIISIARRGWRLDPSRALLLLAPIPFALYLAYHSLGEWIGVHWIAPIVIMAAIYAAFGVDRVAKGPWGSIHRISRATAVPLGVALTLIFYGATIENYFSIPPESDSTSRFRGWQEMAESVEQLRVATGAAYILTPDYSGPAYHRFYLGGSVPAFQLGEFQRWSTFDGLGTADPSLLSEAAIYVGRGGAAWEQRNVARYFNTVIRIGDVVRPTHPGQAQTYPAFLVSNPRPEALALFGLTSEDFPASVQDARLEATVTAQ